MCDMPERAIINTNTNKLRVGKINPTVPSSVPYTIMIYSSTLLEHKN
jgi:hypothetical protein